MTKPVRFLQNFLFLYQKFRVLCQNQMVKGDTEFTHILLKGPNLPIANLTLIRHDSSHNSK